jgi:hypothetical protein
VARKRLDRFDSTAEPYGVEQINRERAAYRSEGAALRTEPLPGTSDPGAYDADFLIHYRAIYTSTGGSYEDYAPAYRYGYSAGSDARYRGRDWNEVETDVRRDWERSYPERTWDRFKDAVRHGWEKVTGKQR